MKEIVVLTGAGISAESGLKTFRDADGLWEGYKVMDVASPIGWEKDKKLVLDFYNMLRAQLLKASPNLAHKDIVKLETKYNVNVITQNVDDLHERAGSSHVLHLHGELLKIRSSKNPSLIYNCTKPTHLGDLSEDNSQLRPHIVWFGEAVPNFEKAIEITKKADILIIIGTSMQVYPAANLIDYINPKIPVYFVDPKPNIQKNSFLNLTVISEKASVGVSEIVNQLIDL